MQAQAKSQVPGELLALREQIDAIDDEILAALARRFAVTARVGQLKAASGLESVDPVREQEKLLRLRQQAEAAGLSSEFVDRLFQLIMDEVVKNHQQYRKQAESGA